MKKQTKLSASDADKIDFIVDECYSYITSWKYFCFFCSNKTRIAGVLKMFIKNTGKDKVKMTKFIKKHEQIIYQLLTHKLTSQNVTDSDQNNQFALERDMDINRDMYLENYPLDDDLYYDTI